MSEKTASRPTASELTTPRRRYTPPAVIELGRFEDLTEGALGSVSDGSELHS